ncbi:uncharacterized protein EDB91DRAFT_1083658 [Suillus paluster]|uniref:uncharacterized protein n=1 Tax=Suillus paluster TaxID=48578 RepID=UPI001B878FBB|nr:uncharacterized protein EDB91DRAFT_1083658 [Suillus paluster]KAG1735570.1 hypothetical protein EDB91DRAFT_1083658 [Suillus paluster]
MTLSAAEAIAAGLAIALRISSECGPFNKVDTSGSETVYRIVWESAIARPSKFLPVVFWIHWAMRDLKYLGGVCECTWEIPHNDGSYDIVSTNLVPSWPGGDLSSNFFSLSLHFGEEFAILHLQHFTECCHIESVVPPQHYPASQVNLSVVPHLLAPMATTGSRIHCSVCPSQQFQHNLQANAKFNTVSFSAVWEGRAMALLDSNMLPNKI